MGGNGWTLTEGTTFLTHSPEESPAGNISVSRRPRHHSRPWYSGDLGSENFAGTDGRDFLKGPVERDGSRPPTQERPVWSSEPSQGPGLARDFLREREDPRDPEAAVVNSDEGKRDPTLGPGSPRSFH